MPALASRYTESSKYLGMYRIS